MPRLDTEVLSRRTEVARRYLQGEMQADLAASFGVSQQQISQDLIAIRKKWLASAVRDFDQAKAQELAKIDQVEREYWRAWERSQEDKEIEFHEVGVKGSRSGSRSEGQAGNPAFLEGILRCIDKRCAILGLDAPKRFVIDWEALTPEQEAELAKGVPPDKVLGKATLSA